MKLLYLAFFWLLPFPAAAQLTPDQRLSDFRNLVDLYARRYAGLEWKKAAVGFDALNLTPWLDRVRAVQSDLEFYDLLVEYVADLKDAHDQYLLPTDFDASLPFSVDLYDGKPLIDSLNRKLLPHSAYHFEIGDELLSVDGKTPAEWIPVFTKYVSAGSSRASERMAAELITDRYQGFYPWAANIGDTAKVEIRLADGTVETYDMPWQKSGTPITTLGASPGPLARMRVRAAQPRYREFLERFQGFRLPARPRVVGYGTLAPQFALPATFVPRLGGKRYDSYFSGSYQADDGTRIGYLRVPDFEYPDTSALDKEIQYFKDATDVLVVDVMHNPGGSVCSAEDILSRLSPQAFQGASAEVRVTWLDVVEVNSMLQDAIAYHDGEAIAQLQVMQKAYDEAYRNQQGRTAPIAICSADTNRAAAPTAYTKPVLVLIDEISASSADIFAAMVQDNHVGPLFGYRAMGAGGSPEELAAGVYSEGYTTVTRSLAVRPNPVVTPEFPTTAYIENVGVRPDIAADYMTVDNVLNQGQSFVSAFTAAAVQLSKANRP